MLKILILIPLTDSENQINLPCIWTRNSVFIRLAASLSFSLLDPQRESISSMKIIEGLFSLASWNKFFTNLKKGNRFSYLNDYTNINAYFKIMIQPLPLNLIRLILETL